MGSAKGPSQCEEGAGVRRHRFRAGWCGFVPRIPTIARISAAGGFAQQAQKGQVSVRFANGEVRTRHKRLFGASDPQPGPGSEVFVPVKDPNEAKTDYVSLFGSVAQILAGTIAIIVVLRR
jgi:hypothetical protein